MKERGFSTDVIHRGERKRGAAPLTTPIYETTTFVFESADALRRYNEGERSQYLYSRYENPTVVAVEEKLAALDGTEQALVFSSGMAATSTLLLALLRSGDEVVCSAASYGGTYHLLEDFFPRFGITARFVTVDQLREPATVLGDRTRIVWFESPSNPHLRCVDLQAVADACRSRGVLSVIDNTFANPVNQRPIERGVDLSMQSASKYLGGHSDITAGVVAGRRESLQPIEMARRKLGGVLDPQPAYALGRSLKTLPVRMARHNASGLAVASALEGHPAIARVFYPGLASHPDHALAQRQMSGFGGMVCIDLKGGEAAACRAYDRFTLVCRAASLGGTETLCSLPVLTSHWGYNDEALAAAGVTRGMLRLSIGLEDPDDVIADIRQALE